MRQCSCRSTSGTDSGVSVVVPPEMRHHYTRLGRRHTIGGVDACIALPIAQLLRAGIATTWSCCGHNGSKQPCPSVYLKYAADVERAARIIRKLDDRPWRISVDVEREHA